MQLRNRSQPRAQRRPDPGRPRRGSGLQVKERQRTSPAALDSRLGFRRSLRIGNGGARGRSSLCLNSNLASGEGVQS